MKTKFERMDKNEKKKYIDMFKKENDKIYRKFKMMNILCIIGIIYSIIAFIYDYSVYYSKTNYTLDLFIFILSFFMMVRTYKLKKRIINDFILKKDFN